MKITIYPKATSNARNSALGTVIDTASIDKTVENHSWSPGIFKNNKRNIENFIEANIIALDIDEKLSLVDAEDRLKVLNYEASISLSKSHQKDKNGIKCDRFRIIFFINKTITCPLQYDATWSHLYSLFPEADPQTKDCARFYFPSKFYKRFEGTKLAVKEPEKKEITPLFKTSNAPKKVILGKHSLHFLLNAQSGLNGSFNASLNKAVYEMGRSGLPRDLTLHLIESVSPHALDSNDMTTFNSAWKGAEKKGPYKDTQKGKGLDPEDLFEFLEEEFSDRFHIYLDDKNTRNLILEEYQPGIVRESSISQLEAQGASTLRDKLDYFITKSEMKTGIETWVMHSSNTLAEQPRSFLFKDQDGLTYNRINIDIKPGPTPTFDEFINRCSNKEAFMAFIWSIFEHDSDRQQYLWLVGEGKNGKSSFLRFMETCLGNACTSEDPSSAFSSPYFNASFVGKRLGVFPDTNTRKFVQSGQFKQLTGSDLIPINNKYEKTYSTRLDTKFILVSNNMPTISSKQADLRRILLVSVKKFDLTKEMSEQEYIDLWNAEAGAILHKCKQYYDKLVVNHGTIPVDTFESNNLAADADAQFESIIEKFFEFNEEKTLSITKMYDTLKQAGLRNKIEQSEFKEYLLRKYTIEIKRIGSRNLYHGIGLAS